MTFEHDADDFEPLDANERCDAVYGAYHIGRCDESRDEIALMFDTHWLHPNNPTPTLIDQLLAAAAGLDVQLEAWAFMAHLIARIASSTPFCLTSSVRGEVLAALYQPDCSLCA